MASNQRNKLMQTYLDEYSTKTNSLTESITILKKIPWKQGKFVKQSWPNWIHHMSPYAGRMTPQIAHWLIRCLTKVEDVVLDPFCGIGTVPLEANLLNRNSIGFDLNPYAYVVASAKMERKPLSKHLKFLENVKLEPDLKLVKQIPPWAQYFYNKKTLAELLTLIKILKMKKQKFILGCLIGVAQGHRVGHLSKASALTLPYKPRPDDPGLYKEVIPRLIRKVERMYIDGFEGHPVGKIQKDDARKMPLDENSVDSVITSPPYLDNLDYANSNRLRLALLGIFGDKTKKLAGELKYKEQPYLEMMNKVCEQISRILKPNGLCTFVLGDVHNKKEPINTTKLINKILTQHNLKTITEIVDTIPFNRSVQRTPRMENSSSPPRMDRIVITRNIK